MELLEFERNEEGTDNLTELRKLNYDFWIRRHRPEKEINPEHGYEFSHSLESQIGGQLKAGFAMIGFFETTDSRNSNTYLANHSIKG